MKQAALIGLLMIFLVACTAGIKPPEAPPAPAAVEPPPAVAPALPPVEPTVPGGVKRVTLAAGQPLTGNGIYFINLDTGAAEGWIGEGLAYSQRWLAVSGLLIDRKSGKELRYDPDHQLVTVADQHLLFQVRQEPLFPFGIEATRWVMPMPAFHRTRSGSSSVTLTARCG